MLKLSRKTLYALEAVVDIAYNARSEPVQSKEITERQDIPQRYLEQVMQLLVRADILKGVRGPRGGYLLARERRRITIGEIVRVIAALESNGDARYGSNSTLGHHVIRPIIDEMQASIMARLDTTTIEDLCNTASEGGVARAGAERLDFTI